MRSPFLRIIAWIFLSRLVKVAPTSTSDAAERRENALHSDSLKVKSSLMLFPSKSCNVLPLLLLFRIKSGTAFEASPGDVPLFRSLGTLQLCGSGSLCVLAAVANSACVPGGPTQGQKQPPELLETLRAVQSDSLYLELPSNHRHFQRPVL